MPVAGERCAAASHRSSRAALRRALRLPPAPTATSALLRGFRAGLMMLATESKRLCNFFIPSLGPAPRWRAARSSN